jgi:hypothetical protein
VLPDGIFLNQKFQFGEILEGLAMEDVVFFGHFFYVGTLRPYDSFYCHFCGRLVIFSPFWYFVPRKIWQP